MKLKIGKVYIINGEAMEFDGPCMGALGFRGVTDGVVIYDDIPANVREATDKEEAEMLSHRALCDIDKAKWAREFYNR